MDFNDFAGDSNLEENGAWIALDDAEFLIAAHLNRRHRQMIAKLQGGKYAKAIRKGEPAGQEAMQIECLAATILLGWRGKVEIGGEPLEYSRAAAERILRLKPFREWVLEQSTIVSNFVNEKEVADVAETKSGARVEPEMGAAPSVPS